MLHKASTLLALCFLLGILNSVTGGGQDSGENTLDSPESDSKEHSRQCRHDRPNGYCTWHHQMSWWQRARGQFTKGLFVTDSNSQPYTVWASKTVGTAGPIGMGDHVLLYQLQQMNRERIPERILHAKGTCARGVFELTSNALAKFTKAPFYNKVGFKYNCTCRLSTTTGGLGAYDTEVDVRGFGIKCQTPNGIVDFLTLSTPIFSIWDPYLFMSFLHSNRKNPQTNFYDYNMKWDFIIQRKEALCHALLVYSSRGCPSSWCKMATHGIHTFTLTNEKEEKFLGRFHLDPVLGEEGMPEKDRQIIRDEDHLSKLLWDQVAEGKRPCAWHLSWQILAFQDAERLMEPHQNPFDTTRSWDTSKIPKQRVGTFTINDHVENHFEFCECLAFNPAHLPAPGVEFSCFDPIADGRTFAYSDAQTYRLGQGFKRMHVNRPTSVVFNHYRDGHLTGGEPQNGAPNYFPNTYDGSKVSKARVSTTCGIIQGFFKRTDTQPFMQPVAECQKFMQEINSLGGRRAQEELDLVATRIADEWKLVEKRLLKKLYVMFAEFGCSLLALITEKLLAISNDPHIDKTYCRRFFVDNCSKKFNGTIPSRPIPIPTTVPTPRPSPNTQPTSVPTVATSRPVVPPPRPSSSPPPAPRLAVERPVIATPVTGRPPQVKTPAQSVTPTQPPKTPPVTAATTKKTAQTPPQDNNITDYYYYDQ